MFVCVGSGGAPHAQTLPLSQPQACAAECQPEQKFLPKTIKVSGVWIIESVWHACVMKEFKRLELKSRFSQTKGRQFWRKLSLQVI